MSDLNRLKSYTERLRVNQVNGSDVMTEPKRLALMQTLDYYEGVTLDEINSNHHLRAVMEQDFVKFYEILEGLHSEKQVVFIDTSRFGEFYKKNLQPHTKQDFQSWIRDFVATLKSFYQLPPGEELNIDFTTTRPPSGSYITVAITTQDFDDFMYSEDDLKIQLVRSLLYGECGPNSGRGKKVGQIIDKVAKQFAKLKGEREKMMTVANDPEFKKLVPKGGFGRYVAKGANEFGNTIKEGVIWIAAHDFLEHFEVSLNVLHGRGSSFGDYIPWIGMGNGQNIVKAFAETVAHELGHALGLSHPGHGVGCFDNRMVPMIPSRQPHLMDQIMACDRQRPNVCRFSNSHLNYLKYILGIKRKKN